MKKLAKKINSSKLNKSVGTNIEFFFKNSYSYLDISEISEKKEADWLLNST